MTSLFWLAGFVWEPYFQEEPPILWLSLISLGCASSVAVILFRRGKMLIPEEMHLVELVKVFIGRWLISYAALVPVVGVATWIMVQAYSPTPAHPEASIYVIIMAVWFPLWLSPMVASLLAWRRVRVKFPNGL